jgi:DnaJ-class molecular chaperone
MSALADEAREVVAVVDLVTPIGDHLGYVAAEVKCEACNGRGALHAWLDVDLAPECPECSGRGYYVADWDDVTRDEFAGLVARGVVADEVRRRGDKAARAFR